MTISINGSAIPVSIRDIGSYVWVAFSEERQNGLGETVTAGLPSVTWTFPILYPVDFAWWATTLLAGAFYLKADAVLPNDLDTEISYSQVIVRRPTYSGRQNGLYQNVVVKIDTMKV
jgi:hypothetical protein